MPPQTAGCPGSPFNSNPAPNPDAHLLLGLALRRLKQYSEAKAKLLEAARQDPGNYSIAYLAGIQLMGMGEYEPALPFFYQALQINPRFLQAMGALANAHHLLGNESLARNYLRKYLEADPSADAADVDLAYLLMRSEDSQALDQALRHAQRAVTLNPASADAHYVLGRIFFQSGPVTDAIPELPKANDLKSSRRT